MPSSQRVVEESVSVTQAVQGVTEAAATVCGGGTEILKQGKQDLQIISFPLIFPMMVSGARATVKWSVFSD